MLLHTTLLLKTLGEPPTRSWECSTISPCPHSPFLPVLWQEDTPGGSIPWKTHLAFMKWKTLYWGRRRGRPLLRWQRPGCRWPSSRWPWGACGLFSAPCSSGASSRSLRGGSRPASSPPHSSAFSTTSISWQHNISSPAVTPGPPQLTVFSVCPGMTDWGVTEACWWHCPSSTMTVYTIGAPGSAFSASSTDDLFLLL